MKRALLAVATFFLLLSPLKVFAEASVDDMNKSNNPLTPMLGLNLHDYITSSIFGTDDDSNSFFLRGALPHAAGGLPQIARLSIPYSSVPDPNGGSHITGLGDANLFDIFLIPSVTKSTGWEVGVGPYFVFPTASKDETGAGKWQIGASAIAIKPGAFGMFGALLTYQHDYAGDSDRPTQNIATLQPFLIYNLPQAFYLRSTGIWYFNWQTGDYYMPVGLGLGKVWKTEGKVVINAFVEPQWTVAHEGNGVPNYQTFIGLNFQFPLM